MKKIFHYLSLSIVTAFVALAAFVFTGCEISFSQTQSTHTCRYGEFSPSALAHEKSGEQHDFLKMLKPAVPEITDSNGYVTQTAVEAGPWAKNYTADEPFVKAYCMTYDLTLKETVTFGENVYVGICTHSAQLKLDGGEIIMPENSKLFIFDCAAHVCYAGMEGAKALSTEYLEFAYLLNGQSTYSLPAGNYALNEPILLSEYVTEGKLTFQNASNTSICMNNFAQGVEWEKEISFLRNQGIQRIYRNCDEFDATHQKHICTYIQDEMNSIPLSQEKLDEMLPTISQLNVSAENPLANYYFMHLTEDVSYANAVVLPKGIKVGICRNGFKFDVPDVEGIYVFDCKEHVCVGDTLNVMTPIWKDGLEIMNSYLKDVHAIYPSYPENIVLEEGMYALMDDFAAGELPSSIVFGENVKLCRNGHAVAENENAYGDGYTWDCQSMVDESIHGCGKLPSGLSIIPINYQTAEEVLTSGVLATQGDVAIVMEEDLEIPSTLVIPQGTSLYLCLNGHSLVASQSLHDSGVPYIFFVEFGASLTIVNCSNPMQGGLFVLTEDMLLEEDSTYDQSSSPIYNMGNCNLNNLSLMGAVGVQNAGHLVANNCTIAGLMAGVMSSKADDEDFTLYSQNPTVELNNCEIVSLMCGSITLNGAMEMNNCSVNSMLAGVVHTNTDIIEGETVEMGALTLNNVEISMSMDMVREYGQPELVDDIKNLLEGGVIGVVATGEIKVEGDINIQVDSELLEPFVNKSGKLITPQTVDFVLAQAQFNVADNIELSEQYTVYCVIEEDGSFVVANKDISENLLLMGGVASVMNNQGEMVVVAGDEALFMKNAVVYDVSISMEGYLRLEIYFKFDTAAQYLFLSNEKSRVLVNIGGQMETLTPADLKTGTEYVYTIDLYAMDYNKLVNVQFTNGEYTWMGIADVSIENILVGIMAELNISVDSAKSVLSNVNATEQEISNAKQVLTQSYALKNAIISMLNYCNLAAVQFGTQDSYKEIEEPFTFIMQNTETDETTGESTVVEEELTFNMAQAMEFVSVEMLEKYKLQIAEGARLPEGVTFLGASLILDSGLDIRFYFRLAEGRELQSLTFLVDGEKVIPSAYKNTADTYYLVIDEISAFDIMYMFNVVIQDTDMQAENSQSYSFTYGTLSYMYTALLNENSSESLKKLAKATYIYAEMMQIAVETLTSDVSDETNNEDVSSDEIVEEGL